MEVNFVDLDLSIYIFKNIWNEPLWGKKVPQLSILTIPKNNLCTSKTDKSIFTNRENVINPKHLCIYITFMVWLRKHTNFGWYPGLGIWRYINHISFHIIIYISSQTNSFSICSRKIIRIMNYTLCDNLRYLIF